MNNYWIDFVACINQLTNPAFWAVFSAIVTSILSTSLNWFVYKKKLKIEKQREAARELKEKQKEETKELKEKQDKYNKELKDLYILYIDLHTQIFTKYAQQQDILIEDIYPIRACMIKISFITKNQEMKKLAQDCYDFINKAIDFSKNPSPLLSVKDEERSFSSKIIDKAWELNKLIGEELARDPA